MTTPTPPLDFQPTGEMSPSKTPFSGTHFSDSDIAEGVVHGARRGSSPQSTDAHRVMLGRGAPGGVHVYKHGSVGHAAIAARKHAHSISGDFAIADVDGPERDIFKMAFLNSYNAQIKDGVQADIAKEVAKNDAESALRDSGWDGYQASKHQPGSVFLFGDQKVSKVPSAKETVKNA